ncbi:hypothetical protein CR513_14003, partial [Mucuna pruriens]
MLAHTTWLIAKTDPFKYIFEKLALTGWIAHCQIALSEYDIDNKVSLSIEEVQDKDLGSWKLSEVIARYSRHTPMDGNLNVWPTLVHHCRPSKAIVSLRSSPVRLCRVCLSRNNIGSPSRSPIETIQVTLTILIVRDPRHPEEGMGLLLPKIRDLKDTR